MIKIRKATLDDLEYLTNSLVKLCQFIKYHGNDVYSDKLPIEFSQDLREYANTHLDIKNGFAYIAELNNYKIGCLYGKIQASQLPVCIKEKVAFISVAWVETEYARKGIGKELLKELENHLDSIDVKHIELSYMSSNPASEIFWNKNGFTPFRVFSHKTLT